MKATVPSDPARSALMSRVRQKGTKAEIAVRRILRDLGASYRSNVRSLPGSPDFANKRRRWVVFVHGCFWHRHEGCRRTTTPKTNVQFWEKKFRANLVRDSRAITELERAGFCVAVVWECETDIPELVRARLSEILEPRRVNVSETIDHRVVVKDVARARRRSVVDE